MDERKLRCYSKYRPFILKVNLWAELAVKDQVCFFSSSPGTVSASWPSRWGRHVGGKTWLSLSGNGGENEVRHDSLVCVDVDVHQTDLIGVLHTGVTVQQLLAPLCLYDILEILISKHVRVLYCITGKETKMENTTRCKMVTFHFQGKFSWYFCW